MKMKFKPMKLRLLKINSCFRPKTVDKNAHFALHRVCIVRLYRCCSNINWLTPSYRGRKASSRQFVCDGTIRDIGRICAGTSGQVSRGESHRWLPAGVECSGTHAVEPTEVRDIHTLIRRNLKGESVRVVMAWTRTFHDRL